MALGQTYSYYPIIAIFLCGLSCYIFKVQCMYKFRSSGLINLVHQVILYAATITVPCIVVINVNPLN